MNRSDYFWLTAAAMIGGALAAAVAFTLVAVLT